jgi:hypothetical protein
MCKQFTQNYTPLGNVYVPAIVAAIPSYRKHGVSRMFLRYLLMSLFFAIGKYRWATRIEYESGSHDP